MIEWTINPYSGHKIRDLAGKKFGMLTVVCVSEKSKPKRVYWVCECECGATVHRSANALTQGVGLSCGGHSGSGCREDQTGKKFGHLTVKSCYKAYRGYVKCVCECDCGNIVEFYASDLVSGRRTSCGHVGASRHAFTSRRQTHGMARSRLYNVWRGIIRRCFDPKVPAFKYYGARGITVCDEWRTFIPFHEWAIASGYDEKAPFGQCTIDRIDPNGNYEPSNCRWASIAEQNRNKRK